MSIPPLPHHIFAAMSRSKKRKADAGLFPSHDMCKIRELVSLPVAAGLIVGARRKALELYEKDRKKIRDLIEAMVGTDLKIFSFENRHLIGSCAGHPWGHIVAARVINLTQCKECIITTLYDEEECSPTYAVRSTAWRANWKLVREVVY